ncbi:MAG: ABC transporter permease [Muribaculaceae bacterium]|nr:ABC transporter permease [Muribaculaceae bacterium]
MKNKILQIIYDLRTQPVIGWVTIIGTALSIFLIMVVVMMQQVTVLSFAPETHRDRMLYGIYIHVEGEGNTGSAGMCYSLAKKLYDNLDGVEEISYNSSWLDAVDAKGTTGKSYTVQVRNTDEGFWRLFDFKLLDGRYYDAEEVAADRNIAVISEKTARNLFGSDEVIGQHFLLDHNDYEVIGVVADVSMFATMAFGEVFTPKIIKTWDDGSLWGNVTASMLIKPGVDFEYIRNQVKGRYASLDGELAAENRKTVYHESPFDQETVASGVGGSNITPDPSSGRRTRYIIYAILLIVPAINLSSMLHSRLRRRVNEIGIRRAFGCTRKRIIKEILSESFIITAIGGFIGLVAAILFALFYGGLYSDFGTSSVNPSLSMLIRTQTFLFALGACFILNIISAAVPAWHASRLNPVEAINTK